jgi:chloride channel protein, CIC family
MLIRCRINEMQNNFKLYIKLTYSALIVGLLSAIIADSLKFITEIYEHSFFLKSRSQPVWFFLFPLTGLFIIYLFRHLLFKNIHNKGLKEIIGSIKNKNAHLPFYKIPSHFINGFFTVASGGSTGIEVSTVVASATIGSLSNRKLRILREYKTELICAGAAAGITALFSSPLAGLLFSFEVLSKKITKVSLMIHSVAVSSAFLFNFLLHEQSLFGIAELHWNKFAIPYVLILGILAGLNSVYLTQSVIFIKKISSKINNEKFRIVVGALIIGVLIFIFPSLYGEGYYTIHKLLDHSDLEIPTNAVIISLCLVLLFKPLITSVTLSVGGDGGIFAPSLFIGAVLGFVVATLINRFFNADVVPLNFILIGMGAVLSSSIHAPLTAIFLICGLTGNYSLLIPLFLACFVSKLIAYKILPYSVYNYAGK